MISQLERSIHFYQYLWKSDWLHRYPFVHILGPLFNEATDDGAHLPEFTKQMKVIKPIPLQLNSDRTIRRYHRTLESGWFDYHLKNCTVYISRMQQNKHNRKESLPETKHVKPSAYSTHPLACVFCGRKGQPLMIKTTSWPSANWNKVLDVSESDRKKCDPSMKWVDWLVFLRLVQPIRQSARGATKEQKKFIIDAISSLEQTKQTESIEWSGEMPPSVSTSRVLVADEAPWCWTGLRGTGELQLYGHLRDGVGRVNFSAVTQDLDDWTGDEGEALGTSERFSDRSKVSGEAIPVRWQVRTSFDWESHCQLK